MRIVIVHNEYGRRSGEEVAVDAQQRLLESRGHEVVQFCRSSAEIPRMTFGRARAFFSGVHSEGSRREMGRLLREQRPDLVHVHNLYPLISPAILSECRKAGVPVVMTLHNYRLICPNGLLMTNGRPCERCADGSELWCVLLNCEGQLAKSAGYALRNWSARCRRLYLDNVTRFAALTSFQRSKLIEHGFDGTRIMLLPTAIEARNERASAAEGTCVGYAGRLSPEKGVEVLLEAARLLTDVPIRIAGDAGRMPGLATRAPANVELLGHLDGEELDLFFRECRALVVPSVCYESMPMAALEAMAHARPVVASRIGGLPEIVEHDVTGLLAEPGDAEDLAHQIRRLWDDPGLAERLGAAGAGKARQEHSPERHYERLMAVYREAIDDR